MRHWEIVLTSSAQSHLQLYASVKTPVSALIAYATIVAAPVFTVCRYSPAASTQNSPVAVAIATYRS